MSEPVKQHLIDPEICIRCYTCENTCSIGAITHNDDNVVVDASKCNFCMDCIAPCPTGSIDHWRVVTTPFSLDQQFEFEELPEQQEIAVPDAATSQAADGDVTASDTAAAVEALEDSVAALLREAHSGARGRQVAPATAAQPTINQYNLGHPLTAKVQGNYRLTTEDASSEVRHIILEFGDQQLPVLEGQSIGVLAPGVDANGEAHLPRLYSVASPRDGERQNRNNVALTVKREDQGVCSRFLCATELGDEIQVTGPFGATFLLPEDPRARLLMICTGTGAAPFRGFTMRRERTLATLNAPDVLFFGARSEAELPYFGPLQKVPRDRLQTFFALSREPGQERQYVQDLMQQQSELIIEALGDAGLHVYICGLRAMEQGVESAFTEICSVAGISWDTLREQLREEGRLHLETY